MAAESLVVSQTSIDSDMQMCSVVTCQTSYLHYLSIWHKATEIAAPYLISIYGPETVASGSNNNKVLLSFGDLLHTYKPSSEISVSQLRLEQRMSVLSQHVQKFSG